MIDTAEIYQRLSLVFRDVFEDEALTVKPGMTADDISGWDSLTNLRLVLTVQKAFGVKFSIKDVRNLKNVGELLELIKRKAA